MNTEIILDPEAPRADVNEIRPLTNEERSTLWRDAAPLCSSVEDDDEESWFLTRGGQFIRKTGKDVYLTDGAYAREMLEDFIVKPVFAFLEKEGFFKDEPVTQAAEHYLDSNIGVIENVTAGTEYLEVKFNSEAGYTKAKGRLAPLAELSDNTLVLLYPGYSSSVLKNLADEGVEFSLSGSDLKCIDLWPEDTDDISTITP